MSSEWPHAPIHRLGLGGIYMVTAGTLHKALLFTDARRLTLFQHELLSLAKHYEWHLEAWAAFANHYHFIARGNCESSSLRRFLTHLHATTARELNRIDAQPGRKVWFNFWDTKLTYERSYLARLNYVHQNPVKHGLVHKANQYRWCSAAWFERVAPTAMVKTIYSFKTDKLNIYDEF